MEFETNIDLDEHIVRAIKASFISTIASIGDAGLEDFKQDFKAGRRNIMICLVYKINCNLTGMIASLKTNASKAVMREIKHIKKGIGLGSYSYSSES